MPHHPFIIDTHCHLDAAEFDRDRDAVKASAVERGVGAIVIPAIAVSNFDMVARLAKKTVGGAYALGIHPILTPGSSDEDLATLRRVVEAAMDDPRFVAIGEIGLDLFVPSLTTSEAIAHQTWFFDEQLKIARDFDLPVLLHVRRAQDQVLAGLRRVRRNRDDVHATGIAHAFNGSRQQADHYTALGFKLGFGGASTFERALRIRALARNLPGDAIVLETDAPDIAPTWIYSAAGKDGRNTPAELPRIAEEIAALRECSVEALAIQTTRNACAVLPRLGALLERAHRSIAQAASTTTASA
ncbi:MAG: TatD family hydrolase [Burkholderiaceae bacterium]